MAVGRFLEWAYDAGLLRVSGPAYQFRHRELQLWLSDGAPSTDPREGPPAQRAADLDPARDLDAIG